MKLFPSLYNMSLLEAGRGGVYAGVDNALMTAHNLYCLQWGIPFHLARYQLSQAARDASCPPVLLAVACLVHYNLREGLLKARQSWTCLAVSCLAV